MIQRPWLKNYPKEIPQEISIQSSSLYEEFKKNTQEFKNQTAFTNYGTAISFKDWDEKTTAFASFLQNECGLKKGDPIAIQMPNLLQTPIAVMGALKAGLIVVNINPLYTPREMKEILQDSKARAVLIFSHKAHFLEQILSEVFVEHIIITNLGDLFPPVKRFLFYLLTHVIKKLAPAHKLACVSFAGALKKGRTVEFKPVNLQPEDTAFLQYTGGTTGKPKGAVLTHRNILSNFKQCQAWMTPYLKKGKETAVIALPLYHIFALTINLFVLPFYGARSLLVTNPRDVKNFIRLLSKEKWTIFTGVNALFKLLLNQKEFNRIDFSSLKYCIAGGSAVEQSVHDQWLKTTKTPLTEGYGLTEASPVVSCNLLDRQKIKTCGLPFPSTHVRVVNSKGEELPLGAVGEVQVQGPQVMQGYWSKKEETKNVLDEKGWLSTGDIGKIDENGYITLLDRKKDMILVSGFNVYPNEIEDILSQHFKVKTAAVIGVSDEHSGEAPKAFIVKKDESLTKEELLSFCKKELTGYKIPKHIEFRQSLPLSPVGKVLRRKLK